MSAILLDWLHHLGFLSGDSRSALIQLALMYKWDLNGFATDVIEPPGKVLRGYIRPKEMASLQRAWYNDFGEYGVHADCLENDVRCIYPRFDVAQAVQRSASQYNTREIDELKGSMSDSRLDLAQRSKTNRKPIDESMKLMRSDVMPCPPQVTTAEVRKALQRGYNLQREVQTEDLKLASGSDLQDAATIIIDEPTGDLSAKGTSRNLEPRTKKQQLGSSGRTEAEASKALPFGDKSGPVRDATLKWNEDLRLHTINNERPTSMPFVPAARGNSRHALTKLANQRRNQQEEQRRRDARSAPPPRNREYRRPWADRR